MRFTSLIASASILGAAVSTPIHGHKDNKRDVEYVTNRITSTVVVNGNAPMTLAGASTTLALDSNHIPAAATAAASPVSDVTRENAAPTEAVSTTAAAPSTTASSSSAAAASSSSSSAPSSSDLGSGFQGITYSPYSSNGACKSAEEVASDIAALSSYGTIRLYGVDCNQVENVFKAKAKDQKLFLGVYFMDQIEAGVKQIADAVSSYGSWDDVVAVSIGNELVNSGAASVETVGSYISTGRSALTGAGYSGPVVSVETFTALINNPGLCEYNDFVAVNAHAYFDQNTAAEDAGPWLMNQIERVWGACNGNKKVTITESGWPSQGQTYGKAVPSKENQQKAIESIKQSCGSATILFTAFNDYWKADGPWGVEKYFGVLSN
ncbi:Glycoside hydrolase, 17 [Kluyveromyces marxianus]|nr:Glycoside hydrolase, 17 [Kluyveromyces marxianus]KAG0683869.1 Glycoside hydrolase, 17 [Kluyveromyces marxianus]